MNKIEFENISSFHPGYYISDLVEELEMTQAEFARRITITPKTLSDVINGKAAISSQMAKNLSLMLGTGVDVWLNLQKAYDQKVLEIDRLKTQREEEKDLALIDYGFFEKLGVVEKTRDKDKQITELFKYLSISSFSVFKQQDMLVQFRQGKKVDEKVALNSNAWVQTVENIGKTIESKKYSERKLKENLPRIREWTLLDRAQYMPLITQLLADCGIAFVPIPSLKSSNVYGAVKWLNRDKAVLGLTDRGKSADIFWFTLLHEIKHVLQKKLKKVIVHFETEEFNTQTGDETVADRYAEDFLIPQKDFAPFVKEKTFSEERILAFAESVRIHPGIVVGRLQKEKMIPYNRLNKLKQSINFSTPALFLIQE